MATENTILNSFKVGVRRPFSKAFWERVRTYEEEDSPQRLGEHFEIARSQVSKGLDHGALSLESMVIVQTCLGWTKEELPDHPSVRERAISGYQEAVHKASTGRASDHNDTLITEAELLSMIALLGDAAYRHKDALNELTEDVWQAILSRILPKIATWLGESVESLPYKDTGDFLHLIGKWGQPVGAMFDTMPYCWAQPDEWEEPHE